LAEVSDIVYQVKFENQEINILYSKDP